MRKLIILLSLSTAVMCGCSEDSDVKYRVDISEYKGCILLDRSPDYRYKSPIGSYIHTFRKNDSIWSESYMYGVFAQFQKGDTIK